MKPKPVISIKVIVLLGLISVFIQAQTVKTDSFIWPSERDSDDSDNRIGPFNTNYYGIPIMPEIELSRYVSQIEEYPIEMNGVHTFNSNVDTLKFKLLNTGTAQVNLPLDSAHKRVLLSGMYADKFKITKNIMPAIKPQSNSEFYITRQVGSSPPYIADIRIVIEEDDIPDFTFTIAQADCDTPADIVYVNNDTTWSNSNVYMGNVAVTNGATLIVNSTTGFAENKGLYIMPGSKIILDSGKLTKACDGLWTGVTVYGIPDTCQSFEDYHGIIRVINNGIVEYAQTGIKTFPLEPDSMRLNGGIIKIDSGTIRNNIIGIKFNPYHNTNPNNGQYWPNVSYIKNCQFITDEGLYSLNETPEQHIMFLGVSGIPVTACTFYNTTQPQQDPAELGKGILSVDADFFMNGKCVERDPITLECTKWQQSRFSNLDYGVYAVNTSSNKSPLIKRTLFEKNKTGIYLSMTPQASVTLCDFDVNKKDYFPANEESFVGLYINDQCDGFQVEENYFYNSDAEPLAGNDNCIGVIINNSGETYNLLYNNAFDNLNIGTLAQEKNRNQDGTIGLEIKCNDYAECEYDIVVSQSDTAMDNLGIKYLQGTNGQSTEDPAGNLFTIEPPHDDESNYYNPHSEEIVYWYHRVNNGYNIIPIEHSPFPQVDTSKVDENLSYQPENSCPSNLNTTGGVEEERSLMITTQNSIDSTEQLLTDLTDGGDTEGLNFDIQTSMPEDGLELRDELLNTSPYLSDTVLINAVNKEDVLPSFMITEVLTANPQSAKSDKVMDEVHSRMNPLSNNQIGQIEQGWFIQGAKEILESQLAEYYAKKYRAMNTLIRYYSNDTVNPDNSYDSIADLLGKDNRLWAKYQLCLHHINQDDTTSTEIIFDSIPEQFDLSADELNLHNEFSDYMDILKELIAENKCIFIIDSSKKQQFYTIHSNANNGLKAYCRNLLIAIDTLNYTEPVIIPPGGLKSRRVIKKPNPEIYNDPLFKVYPNPANSYIIIEFNSEISEINNKVSIFDNKARLVKTMYSAGKSYLIIRVSNLPAGIYFINLQNENKSYSEQFIITK